MDSNLGRVTSVVLPHRHKWRLRHSLGEVASNLRAPEGVQQKVRWFSIGPFVLYPRARTLNAPPYQGGREGVNFRAHDCASASSAVEPLRGYRSEKRKFLAFLLLLNELSSPPWGAPVAYRMSSRKRTPYNLFIVQISRPADMGT